MGILWWIVVGVAAGWLAGVITGSNRGIVGDLILGLIGAFVFRKFNHIRNYKACKKGALIGLATFAAVILFFALMLVFAVL